MIALTTGSFALNRRGRGGGRSEIIEDGGSMGNPTREIYGLSQLVDPQRQR